MCSISTASGARLVFRDGQGASSKTYANLRGTREDCDGFCWKLENLDRPNQVFTFEVFANSPSTPGTH